VDAHASGTVGVPVIELLARDPAAGIDGFLQLCEDRQLDVAQLCMRPDVTLFWPGGARYSSLQEMVAGAAGRYRWVKKHRDHYAVGTDTQGRTVVTSRGRLFGENLHGVPFEDIRYVDVFVLEDGLIVEQHVWNDFPLSDVLTRTAAD
jgi:hypothetical protein